MASAVQSHSSLLRRHIEETLAARGGARLSLAPRLVRDGFRTGYDGLDAVLRGGLPVAGTSEIVGSRSSGRATIAAAYLAERTREGHVCAWVDVSGDMTPEAFMADAGDLDRVLWVRCAGLNESQEKRVQVAQGASQNLGGLRLVKYAKDKSVGTPGVPNRALGSSEVRTVQVATDRLPKRRGELVLRKPVEREAGSAPPASIATPQPARSLTKPFVKLKKPWGRLEQAIKSVDLLVQAGGFGTIVLDMGGIRPEDARKIPLATWFRWRAALERTRTGLVVLSQTGCAGSSAELMLRVEAELPQAGTVMQLLSYRLEVVRRRFEQETAGRKKAAERASAWESRAGWVAS